MYMPYMCRRRHGEHLPYILLVVCLLKSEQSPQPSANKEGSIHPSPLHRGRSGILDAPKNSPSRFKAPPASNASPPKPGLSGHSEIFLQDTAKRRRLHGDDSRPASAILREAAERELQVHPDEDAAHAAGRLSVRELKQRLRLLGVCDDLLDGCRERSELIALFSRTCGSMVDVVRAPAFCGVRPK
jgi:hypothetical protein